MSSLITDVVGQLSYEGVITAASVVSASAMAAGVYHGCRKERPVTQAKKTGKKGKKGKKKGKKEDFTSVIQDLKNVAASAASEQLAYTFLNDAGKENTSYSFAEVDAVARRVAACLQKKHSIQKGDRVALCYPPGLDFALAFWGCLYAGAVAVPVYPPYPGTLAKDLPKFTRLVEDSGAKCVLTCRSYQVASQLATAKAYLTLSKTSNWPEGVTWVSTDALASGLEDKFEDVALESSDLAFFQYSSGSTAAPKAIMISHGNIRAQLRTWDSITKDDTLVSWLPSYHDMGLVGFIIMPCVNQARCVSMSPISFIKDPGMWMRIVDAYQATHICAPNFGYALAARKTTDEKAEKMDLRCLKQAICAAEPIRRESLDDFTSKFKKSGFDPKTFNTGYGLAEVTLVCTGQDPMVRKKVTNLDVSKEQLEKQRKAIDGHGMTLVSCGKAAPTFQVKIVRDGRAMGENEVGEIWVSGPSVAQGYWQRPQQTKEAFHADLNGQEYLRTGDLGFLRKDELFVTGRLKDLIIVRGRNIAPQDVEATVENAHEGMRPGCSAAFSVERNGEEVLVVAAEVRHGLSDLESVAQQVAGAVLREHQLKCEALVLLPQRGIPKTTSGKIQRSAAKLQYEQGQLKSLLVYKPTVKSVEATAPKEVVKAKTEEGEKSPEQILQWLLERLEQEVGQKVSTDASWSSFGLDSVALVGLSSELGEFLGCVVPPAAFFQFETPEALAHAPGLPTGDVEVGETRENELQVGSLEEVDASTFDIEAFPEVQYLQQQMKEFSDAGLHAPFLESLTEEKRQQVNFNTYNYLGHASDKRVHKAMQDAVDEYGSTMSSSPIVGQTLVNEALERELCSFFRSEAATLFVGGWVANVATLEALVGPHDLILCDALNHNSCVSGQKLSGAVVQPFPHNDMKALERMLSSLRLKYRRVLIVVESVYSMDGDVVHLPQVIELKKKYKAMLFLDEAHSFGTMGKTGKGLVEHFGCDPADVDIRMGTMSKALASVGGFILGSKALASYLKHCAGGFVFSVGLSPAHAAAALRSLELMQSEGGKRTQQLQDKASYFYDLCVANELPIGERAERGAPVIVVVLGSTITTAQASKFLSEEANVNVKPIVHPAVEEGKCRLRFFISVLHERQQLEKAVKKLTQYVKGTEVELNLVETPTEKKSKKSVKKQPADGGWTKVEAKKGKRKGRRN